VRAKDIAEVIKQYAVLKGMYAAYKTALSGTIYMIVKKDRMDDHWVKIRIGRHKLEDSKHYNDKFKTDDVDIDLYRTDGKWDPKPAIDLLEERYGKEKEE
jgi:hypothetical protein